MELFEQRGYFFCRYCGTFHFPESTGPEGVRVITDAPGRDRGNHDAPARQPPASFANLIDAGDAGALASADDPLTLRFRLLS